VQRIEPIAHSDMEYDDIPSGAGIVDLDMSETVVPDTARNDTVFSAATNDSQTFQGTSNTMDGSYDQENDTPSVWPSQRDAFHAQLLKEKEADANDWKTIKTGIYVPATLMIQLELMRPDNPLEILQEWKQCYSVSEIKTCLTDFKRILERTDSPHTTEQLSNELIR
jgi:hypothetical protein